MMILRLNRDTKAFAFFRNEIDKFVRKSRVKKRDKDKIFAFRDSSMRDSRLFRDFVFESESQFESSSQFELVVDLFTVAFVAFVAFVVSIAFVASIVSASIDNATLLEMLFQLLFSSFETISSSIDSVAIFVATFVTNSFSIDSITTFVASVIVSIVIFEMIEIVDDSNMNDIDVLLKKYDRRSVKKVRSCADEIASKRFRRS
jgi:sensor histidine kinase YesM